MRIKAPIGAALLALLLAFAPSRSHADADAARCAKPLPKPSADKTAFDAALVAFLGNNRRIRG